jgi:hypothetical protein
MMKWRFILFVWIFIILMTSGCSAKAGLVTSISLDFPHGGLRLLVKREGEARLFYAALPNSRDIAEGTFDIDELFDQLQPRLHKNVPAEARPLGQPYGMVSIDFKDGSSSDYLIYDEKFASELLQRACQHMLDETDSGTAIFEQECANLPGMTLRIGLTGRLQEASRSALLMVGAVADFMK